MTEEKRTHQQGLVCPHCFREVHGEADLNVEIGGLLFAVREAVRSGVIKLTLVKNRRKEAVKK